MLHIYISITAITLTIVTYLANHWREFVEFCHKIFKHFHESCYQRLILSKFEKEVVDLYPAIVAEVDSTLKYSQLSPEIYSCTSEGIAKYIAKCLDYTNELIWKVNNYKELYGLYKKVDEYYNKYYYAFNIPSRKLFSDIHGQWSNEDKVTVLTIIPDSASDISSRPVMLNDFTMKKFMEYHEDIIHKSMFNTPAMKRFVDSVKGFTIDPNILLLYKTFYTNKHYREEMKKAGFSGFRLRKINDQLTTFYIMRYMLVYPGK